MKRLAILCVLFFAGTLAGCASLSGEIATLSKGGASGAFSEVKDGSSPSPGVADIVLKASIKTHLEGYYPFESKQSPHGKREYPFVINVDGQAVTWQVEGARDSEPLYDESGKRRKDPEVGEGMEYVLHKRIRLAPGIHAVHFVLPAEKYAKSVTVNLRAGETAVLEFQPVYRYDTKPVRRVRSFLKGIKKYKVLLNGQPVKDLS